MTDEKGERVALYRQLGKKVLQRNMLLFLLDEIQSMGIPSRDPFDNAATIDLPPSPYTPVTKEDVPRNRAERRALLKRQRKQ